MKKRQIGPIYLSHELGGKDSNLQYLDPESSALNIKLSDLEF